MANRNSTPGAVGLNGPNAGQTPPDDSDLSNTRNPHSQGSPPIDLSNPSTYPLSSPPGYFAPSGPSDAAGNPNSQGAPSNHQAGDESAAQSVAGAFDALYNDILRERQPGNAQRGGGTDPMTGSTPEPNLADYYRDESFGRFGEGQS
jgi:hypothetical protein